MKTIWTDLLHLFYPNLCRLCRKPLVEGEEHLCLSCLCNLPYAGKVKGVSVQADQLFSGKFPFGEAFALLEYSKGSTVRQLIHDLKYHDNKSLGYWLGRWAALDLQRAGSRIGQADLLLPVPLHPRKQRERGYNQAFWIACGLQSVWNLPIETQALQRIRYTQTQTLRSSNDSRQANVQGAFAVSQPARLQNKQILLVDDVITTGSTLEACATAVLSVPGTSVSLFSLGIA